MNRMPFFAAALFAALALLAGCSAGGKKIPSDAVPGWVNLPKTIEESFSCRITDPQARQMIKGIEAERLGPAKRLEIKLLKQLVAIERPEAIGDAFDKVWEEEKALRSLLAKEDPPAAFAPALALSYFMLTCGDGYSWRDRAAEKIDARALKNLDADRLSGYPLHFYTLALLKNGRFDAAWPFLKHLKKVTPPTVYLEDLVAALGYAEEKPRPRFTGEVIEEVLLLCDRNDLPVPEENIASALAGLKASGAVKPAADILLADDALKRSLGTYAFFEYIAPYQEDAGKQPAGSPKPTEPSEAAALRLRDDAVRLRVQVIAADNETRRIDPALGQMGPKLTESLQASQIYLKEEKTFLLAPGQKEEMQIDPRHDLAVLVQRASRSDARIKVTVRRDNDAIYDTMIDTKDGGETIIGGPALDGTRLLLRLTAWLDI
jgi:hypothetical protein